MYHCPESKTVDDKVNLVSPYRTMKSLKRSQEIKLKKNFPCRTHALKTASRKWKKNIKIEPRIDVLPACELKDECKVIRNEHY